MQRHLCRIVLIVLGNVLCLSATAAEPAGDPAVIPDGAKLEQIWNEGEFTEGVAVAPDGTIYFSDIAFDVDKPGRVMKFDPKTGKVTVHCADSGKSNGLMFDRHGKLMASCGANKGARGLCEITADGKVKVIVGTYHGKKFNAPNDLVILPNGTIYFSDPRYVGPEPMELDAMCVYRYSPADGSVTPVTSSKADTGLPLIEKPNGVHVSPDGRFLYVAETNNGSTDVTKDDENTKKGRMTLNAIRIRKNGTLGRKRVLVDFGKDTGTDGMTVDVEGNIYAAVRAEGRHGIIVYSPQGKERAYIPIEPLPTNCCFGRGEESSTLYITAGGALYRIRLKIDGYHPATAE